MNFNQLKIFYFSAKYGSFSAAAEALFISQPAVTKGIQKLHDHYEIKFINRFGKKMALTDAGEVLYRFAEKIFEIETQAEESIRDFQQQKRGHIRILANDSFGEYYLPSIIIPFNKSNRQIKVSVNILPTDQIVANTTSLNNDIGFISYRVENEKLTVKKILEDRLIIIVASDNPLRETKMIEPNDLEGKSMVMHEVGASPRKAFNKYIRRNGVSVVIAMELSGQRAILEAVENGIGIGLMPKKVASEKIRTGKLIGIPISDQSLKRKFYMIYHKDKYFSDPFQSLIKKVNQWTSKYKKDNL